MRCLKKLPLDLSKRVLGQPQYVQLNNQHWLNLNEEYLILPGKIKLKLNGSSKPTYFEINEGERFTKIANSVTVSFSCKPWDYECLGQKKIFLYKKDFSFPFSTGYSDIALLYFEKDAYVSLQGSKNVKYYLSNKKVDHNLSAGYVNFIPVYKSRTQYFTDLTRIETTSKNFIGASIDFPIGTENKIPLLTGVYSLAQYNSTIRGDFDRQKNTISFYVSKDKIKQLKYSVSLSERRFKYYTKKKAKSVKKKKSISRKNIQRLSPTLKFN